MTPREIKKLGSGVWGYQSGLLSVAELELLMLLVRERCVPNIETEGSVISFPFPKVRILEVGHYNGLSTCAIVRAARDIPGADWELVTVDSHESDQWVPATDTAQFERNRRDYFDDPRLTVKFERSQTLTAELPFDLVFYDGDHGEEQLRFTCEVLKSPRIRTFVFDDRDFDKPRVCCEVLREHGWIDESPPLVRGVGDKRDAETQTLAVFRRGES